MWLQITITVVIFVLCPWLHQLCCLPFKLYMLALTFANLFEIAKFAKFKGTYRYIGCLCCTLVKLPFFIQNCHLLQLLNYKIICHAYM